MKTLNVKNIINMNVQIIQIFFFITTNNYLKKNFVNKNNFIHFIKLPKEILVNNFKFINL